jgi:hypothetical protein
MGCLREISGRLTDAAAIAKAAVTCAESGSEHQAVSIVLELDEMLHEANTLLNGVTLLNRMRRDRAAEPEPDRLAARQTGHRARSEPRRP